MASAQGVGTATIAGTPLSFQTSFEQDVRSGSRPTSSHALPPFAVYSALGLALVFGIGIGAAVGFADGVFAVTTTTTTTTTVTSTMSTSTTTITSTLTSSSATTTTATTSATTTSATTATATTSTQTNTRSLESDKVDQPPSTELKDFVQRRLNVLALGVRCTTDVGTPVADPADIGDASTEGAGRAAEILRELWACRSPAGVRPVGAGVPVAVPQALAEAAAISPGAVRSLLEARPAALELPAATVDWGSGGDRLGRPDENVEAFLVGLFRHIADLGLGIELSKQDLFHGHTFALPSSAQEGSTGEVGILFHAKEYPSDLRMPQGEGSPFTTDSPEYADRNILWLASTNQVYVIDPNDESGRNKVLLLNLDIAEFLQDWQSPERVCAVSSWAFHEIGGAMMLPDINLLPMDLRQPSGRHAFFTKGFSSLEESLARFRQHGRGPEAFEERRLVQV
mmetsp:Transcript_119859/g.382615  ORF Transcript_119859/g.382615 Transcript_119859/m.382615 type:complete len:455 (-) Transcript_119859:116-1480(-)|eukprot:CAMPEP_0203866988 /NCGR_PEP_ID=MMETSP0359-20131031/16261_1 /ASSEMBLY_ACC=CAM_ASM_000338 /TAXON_ID=268821 /ORGANISM="Scrippsiella Hangoei, Strain SHTV-5" /LENGTH=454 /DNA_ID=CAMNT_0050785165 /DNA_START=26 /DNA_END=1390 /DNA_ORIENTATION=-